MLCKKQQQQNETNKQKYPQIKKKLFRDNIDNEN